MRPLSHPDFEPLLTAKDAARLLSLSTSWLAKSRLRGDGPRYRKVGRAVRYAPSDLREYLKARGRSSTSEL
jgi:hypothetical protein